MRARVLVSGCLWIGACLCACGPAGVDDSAVYADGTPAREAQRVGPALHGTVRTWWPDGGLRSEGEYSLGLRTGTWTTWHPNGVVESRGRYEDGVRHGPWVEWHENGNPATEGTYVRGARVGTWRVHGPAGQVNRSEEWRDGSRREGARGGVTAAR